MVNFSDLKVLVIGDICLDVVEKGTSTRISPEAPVPVILNPTTEYSLGMSGNVAMALKNLGADVLWSGVYTRDESGEIITSLLDKNSLASCKPTYKISWGNPSTITKKRIFANGSQVARVDYEVPYNEIKVAECMMECLQFHIDNNTKFDFIIISDYNKYIITKYNWAAIKPLLLKLSDKFFVDTKKLDVLNYYEGMYLFPNKKEMNEIMEYNNCNTRNELRIEMDLDFLVETASEEGAYIYKDDGKIYHCPAFSTHFHTIYGAGDVFISAFSLHYTKYNNKLKALEFANYCCSKAVMKEDRCSVTLEEVSDFLEKGNA